MYNEYSQQEQAYQQERVYHGGYSTAQQTANMYGQPETFPPTLPHNDMRVVAALTYIFGWFSGLLFALFNRNRYIRFHALQALIFFGAVNIIDFGMLFVLDRMSHTYVPPIFDFLFLTAFMLLNLIAFISWIIGLTQAYRGSYYRLPIVGDMVANMMGLWTRVKN